MKRPSRLHLALLSLAAVVASYAAVAQGGGSSGQPLATFEVTLVPDFLHRDDDPRSDYQAVWLYPTSPTTPYRSPDSMRHVQRYILLDPRASDADGRRGNDEWWFVISRYWPASYNAANHGKWGRQVNFHNVAGDAGPKGSGGVGWGFGSGVSALALDWLPSRKSPSISVNNQRGAIDMPLPVPTRDAWHTYVIHWIAGRTDGSTVRPGAITVWADGSERPVIQRRNIDTVQRAMGPDGRYYTQRWVQLWEGDYTSALPVKATTRLVLTRIGRTIGEALADRPRLAATNLARMYYAGGSRQSDGRPSVRRLESQSAAAALVPGTLRGGSPTPAPPRTTTPPKQKPTVAASVGGLRWDGRRFPTIASLFLHQHSRGVDWERFLGAHPAIVKAFDLGSVRWDGRRFFSRFWLTRYLARSGVSYRRWAESHPQPAAVLARNARARST